MPSCRLPDGTVTFVGSCKECDSLNGGCFDDAVPGQIKVQLPCFVRNVLVRSLSDALLDLGSCESVSAAAIRYLRMGHQGNHTPAENGDQPLTPRLREDLAKTITDGILELAVTYQTTVDFRDHILLQCPRGRELKASYDKHLGDIYYLTALDLELLHVAATVWLSIHHFIAVMVESARGSKTSESRTEYLSSEQYQQCKALFRRFREASKNASFRNFMEEIEREFDGYDGLSAVELLEKLRHTSASGSDGGH